MFWCLTASLSGSHAVLGALLAGPVYAAVPWWQHMGRYHTHRVTHGLVSPSNRQ
jgi:hypothetical protein